MKYYQDRFSSYDAFSAPAESSLHLFHHDQQKRPCLVIFPGGGYQHLAVQKEGLTISDWGQTLRLHTAVFCYQVAPTDGNKLLAELQELMAFLQADPLIDKIVVMGFSAGGHLAGLLGTVCPLKPQGMLLCYPVTLFEGDFCHEGSKNNFMRQLEQEQHAAHFSLPNLVDNKTAPAFIWHTAGDRSVPAANSLLLALALQQQQISYELHIYPGGHHGMGMENEEPHIQQWVAAAQSWLAQLLGEIT